MCYGIFGHFLMAFRYICYLRVGMNVQILALLLSMYYSVIGMINVRAQHYNMTSIIVIDVLVCLFPDGVF